MFGAPALSPVSRLSSPARSPAPAAGTRSSGYRQRSSISSINTPARASCHRRVDLAAVEAVNQELLATRSSEKAELQELNDRFASFIERVRFLEQQNSALAAQLAHIQSQEPGRAARLYLQEIRQLQQQLQAVGQDRDRVLVDKDNLAEDLHCLKQR